MSTPDPNAAMQDAASMMLWAALNARKVPNPTTLAGTVTGAFLWQYVGKQQAASYRQKVSLKAFEADLVKDIETAVGTGKPDFSNLAKPVGVIEGTLEDDLALALLARPGTYLAVLYALGWFAGGDRLTLPEYLVIAGAGAGTGSLWRQAA